jgi:hypothetical protein
MAGCSSSNRLELYASLTTAASSVSAWGGGGGGGGGSSADGNGRRTERVGAIRSGVGVMGHVRMCWSLRAAVNVPNSRSSGAGT